MYACKNSKPQGLEEDLLRHELLKTDRTGVAQDGRRSGAPAASAAAASPEEAPSPQARLRGNRLWRERVKYLDGSVKPTHLYRPRKYVIPGP